MTASLAPLLLLSLGLTFFTGLLLVLVVIRIRSAFHRYHTHGYTRIASRATVGRFKPGQPT